MIGKNWIRILLMVMIALLCFILLYNNIFGGTANLDYDDRVLIIVIIFFAALLIGFYIVYEAYQKMHEEIRVRVAHEKEMQKQISNDNKMAAIGQLAAGVAHEIRNPLGAIRNYCYLLKNSSDYEVKLREEVIANMEVAVDRSNDIINNLLDSSIITNEVWEWIHLKTVIEDIITFQKRLIVGKNIETTIDCSSELYVYTIGKSMDLILTNLLSNAVDAIIGGDNAKNTADSNIGVINVSCAEKSDSVIIEISDNGIGMDEATMEKVFNPFFSTKPSNNGRGLGLYIAYSEIAKIKGDITLSSTVGQGSVFTITIGKVTAISAKGE